jgi:hypothetical protein
MACRFSSLYRKHLLSPNSFARCADISVWRVASAPYTASMYYHLTLARCADINVWRVASAPYTASMYYHLILLLDVRILMYGVSLQFLIPQVCIITSLFC